MHACGQINQKYYSSPLAIQENKKNRHKLSPRLFAFLINKTSFRDFPGTPCNACIIFATITGGNPVGVAACCAITLRSGALQAVARTLAQNHHPHIDPIHHRNHKLHSKTLIFTSDITDLNRGPVGLLKVIWATSEQAVLLPKLVGGLVLKVLEGSNITISPDRVAL